MFLFLFLYPLRVWYSNVQKKKHIKIADMINSVEITSHVLHEDEDYPCSENTTKIPHP